jgi:AbrB family looped-hinge helix DNA binding protein
MATTKLSTKGQVILPKPIRDAHGWRAGTQFSVEEAPGGILLRPLKPFPPTRPEDVYGCLRYRGKPKTIEEMDAGIARMVRERHARGRY